MDVLEKRKKSPVRAGIRTLDRPAPSLITGHTMLTGAHEVRYLAPYTFVLTMPVRHLTPPIKI